MNILPRRLSGKLGFGALILAVGSVLASAIAIVGLSLSSARIDEALSADARLTAYRALSSQISSLAVIGYEPVREDDRSATRASRIGALVDTINDTFDAIARNLEEDVARAGGLGINEQSRRATRGLNLARMRATFDTLAASVQLTGRAPEAVRTDLNIFSGQFQPLLASAVQEEQRIRDSAYAGIAQIRLWLTWAALAVTVLTLAALGAFYFGLIRPQLARLERLRGAARAIAGEDFDLRLPETPGDEIGSLFAEVNRMAHQLGQDRAILEDTIATRTEELRRANEKLTHVDANRRRFFADISHEMRTPLTVILMEAELAQNEAPSAETFPAIIARARLLSRRIDDLLRISKSESGILNIEREPFDLRDAAREGVEDIMRRAERLGFSIKVDLETSCPVNGDQNWTRQIITGLIDNALRHSGAPGAIGLSLRAREGAFVVEIVDGGKGIPEADLPSILARFERGSASDSKGGFGIGLGLADWIMEEHGGALVLSSPPPKDRAIIAEQGLLVELIFPAP